MSDFAIACVISSRRVHKNNCLGYRSHVPFSVKLHSDPLLQTSRDVGHACLQKLPLLHCHIKAFLQSRGKETQARVEKRLQC